MAKSLEIKRPEVLKKAIDTYGEDHQIDLAIEEMSELTKALLKLRRVKQFPERWSESEALSNVIEELADVSLMLVQLFMIYPHVEDVQNVIDTKTQLIDEGLEALMKS